MNWQIGFTASGSYAGADERHGLFRASPSDHGSEATLCPKRGITSKYLGFQNNNGWQGMCSSPSIKVTNNI